MAWFVTTEYNDRELGTYVSPALVAIPEERQRLVAMAEKLAADIEAQYLAGERNRDTQAYPFFGTPNLPKLLEGWRFSIPETPFREKLKNETDEVVDIVTSRFNSYAISDKVVEIIESIEPGVHSYLPYELLRPDGSVHPARRWLLNVCTRAEVIDVEKSNAGWLAGKGPRWFAENPGERKLVVRADEASRRALWCEWRYNGVGGKMIVSDRLYNAVKSAGLKGWQPDPSFPDHLQEI
jgi:hypothetical protein